jgi:FtsH-binding integral membrane protein
MQHFHDPHTYQSHSNQGERSDEQDAQRMQARPATGLARAPAEMIRETYRLLAVGVFSALVSAWFASRTPWLVSALSSLPGVVVCLLTINLVPVIARQVLGASSLMGISVLAIDGLLSGLALSPLVFFALSVSGLGEQSPNLIQAALLITASAFLGVTFYVYRVGSRFQWKGGMFSGLFCSALGLVVVHWIVPGASVVSYLLLAVVGVLGVLQLIYGTSQVLNEPEFRDPVSGALILFAGLFNLFQVILNLLLSGGKSRE